MSLFKTKDYSKLKRAKIVYGGGKKQSEENLTRSIWNFLNKNKKWKKVKDRIIRGIRTLFEPEEKYYYKPIRVSNFWNNNYIEYKSCGDRNKNQSVKEYLDKIKPYLRDNN